MGIEENVKDQLGRQSIKCRSTAESTRKLEHLRQCTTSLFRWIGHILRHDSLLRDIIEGRMKGKVTRGRKRLQMLSDVISKSYEDLKREIEIIK